MKVIYDGKEVADVPDALAVGDTLIIKNSIYEIQTKTFDCDNNDLYCKVKLHEENFFVCDVLEMIYESDGLTTGGINTNDVQNNPRLLVLTILMPILIEEEHLMKMASEYRKNAIRCWADKNINWLSIFTDNPVAINSNLVKIKMIATSLLKTAKIGENIWPDGIK